MTRRTALLALLTAPMAAEAKAAPGAVLTLDLGRWEGVTVKYPGRPDVHISAAEVYEALHAKQ